MAAALCSSKQQDSSSIGKEKIRSIYIYNKKPWLFRPGFLNHLIASLFCFGTFGDCGSLAQSGTFTAYDSLPKFGTFRFVGSLGHSGTFN